MADTPPPSGKPGARKRSPLLIIVVVAGGTFAYILYKRNKANAAAATAATSTTDPSVLTPTPAGTYDPNADTSALLGYLTGLSGQAASGVTATNSPTTSPATSSTVNPYPQVAGNGQAGNQLLDIVGSIVGPSLYQGYNVTGGAPVYALVGGQWKLGVPANQLPVGTKLATPAANQAAITGTSVKETL